MHSYLAIVQNVSLSEIILGGEGQKWDDAQIVSSF